MQKLIALSLTALTLLAPAAAFAQSATVDASADVVAAQQPLEITGLAPLEFGRVAIPETSGTICNYHIADDGTLSVQEGTQGFGNTTTPDGCAYLNAEQQRAQMGPAMLATKS